MNANFIRPIYRQVVIIAISKFYNLFLSQIKADKKDELHHIYKDKEKIENILRQRLDKID